MTLQGKINLCCKQLNISTVIRPRSCNMRSFHKMTVAAGGLQTKFLRISKLNYTCINFESEFSLASDWVVSAV